MKTIARNRTVFIDDLFNRATEITEFSLRNGFCGEPVDDIQLRKALNWGAKLQETEPGKYKIHVHSNLWFTFEVKA